MNAIIFLIIICYIIVTGIWGSIIESGRNLYASDNKMLAYITIGLLFGWIILPIRVLLGIKEIIEERINR